jgi:hypothetical protein
VITIPTVLILGAGASAMYGFPSGVMLRRQILGRLGSPTTQVLDNYGHMGFEPRTVREFATGFSNSGVTSIDAFLEHRTDLINIGKMAIAEALIPFEDEGALDGRESDWYGYLLDRMDSSVEEFDRNTPTDCCYTSQPLHAQRLSSPETQVPPVPLAQSIPINAGSGRLP